MPQSSILVQMLGSGSAFANGRCWSGALADGHVLLDAPPTALYALKRLGADLAALDTVLVSHFHGDHYFGLPFLLLEYAYRTHRERPLTIVGPPGIEANTLTLLRLAYPGLLDRPRGYQLRFVELEGSGRASVGPLLVESVEVQHGGERLLALGFRVHLPGGVLAYTGDSEWCDALVPLGTDARVFLVDATYPAGAHLPEHMSLDEVARLRDAISPTTPFILTHTDADLRPPGWPNTFVAADLQAFTFS